MKRIILTGGGTAGHVTPNIALLPRLKDAGYEVFYIGSVDGMEKKLIEAQGIPYYGIATGKLRRYFDLKNFTDPFRVIKGFTQAMHLMKQLKPDVVFSKGGSGSGNDQIAQGKEIRQLFLHIFELQITWSAFQRFGQLSLAAQMDDLPVFQKFRQCIADRFVHCGSTKTSTHDHQNWSVSGKSSELQGCFAASFRKFFTDGTAGEDCFLRWKILQSLREVAAYLGSRRHGQLVGKTRR